MRFAPEIYTDQVTESRNFYCNNLNFKVKQETDGFIVIEHAENRAYQLLFCQPNSPFINKIFHPKFNGEGIIFQMEVDNIEQEYQRIKKLKIPITLKLVDEPFNGKHFTITDPNGIYIDIAEIK